MSLIDSTLADFGRSLGMERLQLRADGCAVLEINSVGTLSIEVAGPAREAVIISLSRPLQIGATVDWRALLAATHYRARQARPLQAGTARDHLVFAVMVGWENFTLPRIHEAIATLDQQMRRWEVLA